MSAIPDPGTRPRAVIPLVGVPLAHADGVPGQTGYHPRRVLVTGAAGSIGRAVTAHLRGQGVAVSALDLAGQDDLDADRLFLGDASDQDLVRQALSECDAVAHLAAMPSPNHAAPLQVFSNNTRATFTVLEEAGRAGVPRAAIASSYSALGLPWARDPANVHPPYLPIDEDTPLQVEDPYGLSKQTDEAIAAMMTRRHGLAIVALRFPFVGDTERIRDHAEHIAADPGVGAADVWSYLDVRDAAQATWRALTVGLTGSHTVFAAAPQTLAPHPTEELIAAYHPSSELRRPFPGRQVPIDLRRGEQLLGFHAAHELDLPTKPLPVGDLQD